MGSIGIDILHALSIPSLQLDWEGLGYSTLFVAACSCTLQKILSALRMKKVAANQD
jgi:hypothetical protein